MNACLPERDVVSVVDEYSYECEQFTLTLVLWTSPVLNLRRYMLMY